MDTRKAVILARGLGKRMRAPASLETTLSEAQAQAVEYGLKGMIPFGRPFLDYCISALADAGCKLICLVIGPEHGLIREYYENLPTKRVTISFAIQQQPLGTADALRAAADFVRTDSFLSVNSDNYYPVEALRRLRLLGGSGVVGFEHTGLVQNGNINGDRLSGYAVLHLNKRDELAHIEEKPTNINPSALISMNCWSFTPAIFRACAAIGPSARREFEIPSAVQYAIEHLGEHFRVLPYCGGVLDLSTRADIGTVARYLETVSVDL
ncbi:MAG TPA: nucleotidyltransferase family protein [Terriglobales bacterium]|nr:nucleotidyltransferase family protein [Terriglobales bacterium]